VLCFSAPGGAGEDGDGAAVLRPAGDVVAHRHRPLLAVADRLDARRGDALGDQIVLGRLGAAAPSAKLYSRVPRSSAWPSMVKV